MIKKTVSLLMAVVLCIGVFGGCATKDNSSEQITLEVGSWPNDSNPAEQERLMKVKEKFEADFPNVKIVPTQWGYDVKSFLPQAASGQLPTMFRTYFTEVDRIADAGYAADVTEYAEKHGFSAAYSDQIKDFITAEDGKQYMVANSTYAMGMALNKDLFIKAGLVNEDGSLMIPQTYEEVMEFSKIIKEKTGAYGFGMATKGNGGGWHMLNLAWSYGTVFEEKEGDSWKAKFGSQEFVDALTWLKDMKNNGLSPDNALVGSNDLYEMFVTDRLAMMYYEPTTTALIETYAMDRNKVAFASMPAGPAGRYSQMGGALWVISPNATPEQIDACFNWIKYIGEGPELTDHVKETIDSKYKGYNEKGFIVGIKGLSVWNEDAEVAKYTDEVIDKYKNVDTSFYEDYMDFSKVTIKAEEPVACQELYQVISGCMQEALTNENADLMAVVTEAAKNFEINSLLNAE